jgi:lactoylglutathione lyase
MRIEHIAIWVADLEKTRSFYEKYFGASTNELYHNPRTGFSSYFLSFGTSPRLEIMYRADVDPALLKPRQGYAHIAFSVGSRENVLSLTEQLRTDGFEIAGEPRTTGDGYFESVVRDPEGNLVEITI